MTTQKTDQKTKQVVKEVFIVDGNLAINPVQVPLTEWEDPSGYFFATVGGQLVMALRGGWDETTTYAGFGSQQEAEEFRNEKLSNRHRLPHR